MSQSRKRLFYPGPCDEFVGEILYRRQGGTETDFDLYLDRDTRAYFVVGSESHQTGAVLTNNHTRYTVNEVRAQHPAHRDRMTDMVRDRGSQVS
jgi:hypothetical protein